MNTTTEDPTVDVSHRDIFGDSESESEDEFEGFDQPIQDSSENKDDSVKASEEEDKAEKEDEAESEVDKEKHSDNEDKEEESKSSDKDDSDDDSIVVKKRRIIDSDDDDEDDDDDNEMSKAKKSKQIDASSDSEPELDETEKILQEDEDNDDDEEGDRSHIAGPSKSKEKADSEIESDEEDRQGGQSSGMVYDFDIMLQKKKSQNRRRRKKNVDIINDNDDMIAALLADMRKAAEDDFIANQNKMPSTNKLKMLDVVEANLMKIDYRDALLDSGVLRVIAAWLSRLPDGSLPSLKIRTTMLKILTYLNTDDIDMIKSSELGKVVMYITKNPKETKENKLMAQKLVTNWAKNIFNIETEGGANLRDEREKRDYEMYESKRRLSAAESLPESRRQKEEAQQTSTRPGEKGWIPRARVPLPSTKDYVVRPKSKIDFDLTKNGSKKEVSRLDKHIRAFKEKKKFSKTGRMFTVSIEGRKM